MSITKIFKVLQLRRPANLGAYHLLGNEADHVEKGEYHAASVCDIEHSRPCAETDTPKQMNYRQPLRIFGFLLPSFLQASTTRTEQTKLRPTAWLDGLRGVAALFVVIHHMSLIWFSWDIHDGWSGWDDRLIQLPIIRLVVSGPPNVMIFFVISGYALSYKPLSLISKGGPHLKLYETLASSVFRRHSRLFIPALIICSPAPVIAYLGGYRGEGMPGAAIKPMNPPRFETLWDQFSHYAETLISLSDIYSPKGLNWAYSDSLWTLPIEFKSSLVVFTMLVALSRCTRRARVAVTLCVAFYSWWYFHWGELLFIGGMLVVEANLLFQRPSPSTGGELRCDDQRNGVQAARSKSPLSAALRSLSLRRLRSIAVFLAGLFILSMPEQGRGAADSYGFGALVALIPDRFHAAGAGDYFWQPMAAIFIVLVIDRTRFLQRIFTTGLAQYLGRVSFALYLVHMLILHSLGFWLGKYVLPITEATSMSSSRYGIGVILVGSVVGCVIIWAADLGSRFVDANAVRFTAWAYGELCETVVEN